MKKKYFHRKEHLNMSFWWSKMCFKGYNIWLKGDFKNQLLKICPPIIITIVLWEQSFLNSTVRSNHWFSLSILLGILFWHACIKTCVCFIPYTYCTLTRVKQPADSAGNTLLLSVAQLAQVQVLFVHSTLATKANGTRVLLTEVMCTRCPLLDLSFTILYLLLRSLPKPFLRRVIVFDVFNDLFTHT